MTEDNMTKCNIAGQHLPNHACMGHVVTCFMKYCTPRYCEISPPKQGQYNVRHLSDVHRQRTAGAIIRYFNMKNI